MRQDKQLYVGPGPYNGSYGWAYNGDWYFGYGIGGRYGLETDAANRNPKFTINKAAVADRTVLFSVSWNRTPFLSKDILT